MARTAYGPQTPARLGLSSQPGVFSWDRPDPGSVLLAKYLTGLAGKGGCKGNEVDFECLQKSDCPSGQLCCGVDNSTVVGSQCTTPDGDGFCPATPQGAAQFCQTSCECTSRSP